MPFNTYLLKIERRDIVELKSERRNWTREELILAFNLYCKIPFGQIHIRNPKVIELAALISRTPSAVSWKLANFARLDPSLKKRNISGASHGSKSEIEIWNDFNNNWEKLAYESEYLLSKIKGENIEQLVEFSNEEKQFLEGKEKDRIIKTRVNQNFFRKVILATYNYSCCITGLSVPELLIASHIVPWSIDKNNRLNPRNGLCLNAIHDRAFDRGLLSITPDFVIKISPVIKNVKHDQIAINFLFKLENTKIKIPERFIPEREFLEYHYKNIFIKKVL